jgi:hypothetical protein
MEVKEMDIKTLRELCEKATPGPWKACGAEKCTCGLVWSKEIDDVVACCSTCENAGISVEGQQIRANMEFIAAARTALPELLEEVERLRKVFQQACDWIHQDSGCPADVFDWGCPHVGENECQENAVECWEQYFLEKVRDE